MEADVVEGADSPLVDGAGPCGSKEAETLFIILRGMLEEETDKKTKKNSGVDENGEEAIVEKENAEEKRRKWLTETSTREKQNASMIHMIEVASYWACAYQRPLTSGTKGVLSC